MASNRIFKSRIRISGILSPKLIIIASEGTNTERIYFEDMASPHYYRNPKVHVEVLERTDTASSPAHILSFLDSFKHKYRLSLDKDDELWLVIDRDGWTLRELSSVASLCGQKCYLLALSNPCFEFWLLLHIKSYDDYSAAEQDSIAKNRHIGSTKRTFLESELLKLLGSYNKDNPDTSKFLPFIDTAISRARSLDTNPNHRWSNKVGTRVYRLAESIKNSQNNI